jgi:hypothetical protein
MRPHGEDFALMMPLHTIKHQKAAKKGGRRAERESKRRGGKIRTAQAGRAVCFQSTKRARFRKCWAPTRPDSPPVAPTRSSVSTCMMIPPLRRPSATPRAVLRGGQRLFWSRGTPPGGLRWAFQSDGPPLCFRNPISPHFECAMKQWPF